MFDYEETDSEEADQIALRLVLKRVLKKNWLSFIILDQSGGDLNLEIACGPSKFQFGLSTSSSPQEIFDSITLMGLNFYQAEEVFLSSLTKLRFNKLVKDKEQKLVISNPKQRFVFRSPLNQIFRSYIDMVEFFVNSDQAFEKTYLQHWISLQKNRHEEVESCLCDLSEIVKISDFRDWARHCKLKRRKI
jgi:hypothetical protein